MNFGTTILCCTVSIQNVADIWTALAFGPEFGPAAVPSRKAILAVPPPNSGDVGVVETVKTIVLVMVFPTLALRKMVFGSVNIAWVIVPAAMNLVRSCGNLGVSLLDAVWLVKVIFVLVPITNGVMSTAGMFGGPAILVVGAKH